MNDLQLHRANVSSLLHSTLIEHSVPLVIYIIVITIVSLCYDIFSFFNIITVIVIHNLSHQFNLFTFISASILRYLANCPSKHYLPSWHCTTVPWQDGSTIAPKWLKLWIWNLIYLFPRRVLIYHLQIFGKVRMARVSVSHNLRKIFGR